MQACRPSLRITLAGWKRASYIPISHHISTSAASNPEVYDIICVGGGPAGLSLVNGLKANPITSPLRIALIDSLPLSSPATPQNDSTVSTYSNRCVSLTPSSIKFLNLIGAWQHVNRSRVQPYNAMRVWDGVSGARIDFDWPDDARGNVYSENFAPESAVSQSDSIATMAENNNIVSGLLARASSLGGITFFDSTRVESIALGQDTPDWDMRSWPLVTLSSGQTLAARLLIGADGANSPVRTFAGIDSQGWDYDRHGVVATLELDPSTAGDYTSKTAYQRFLPSGPIAMLPLPGNKASLVWTTYPSRAAYIKRLPLPELASLINAAFRLEPVDIDYMHTIPMTADSPETVDTDAKREFTQSDELAWRMQHTKIDRSLTPPSVAGIQEGSVASFPLKLRHASRYTGERVALVGDAAHTIHPLAGQGLNLGLADVEALINVIERNVESGADIGSLISLEAYDAERYARNHVVMSACDKLHKIYSFGSGPVVWGRSIGLGLVDGIGETIGLKKWIMSRATGF